MANQEIHVLVTWWRPGLRWPSVGTAKHVSMAWRVAVSFSSVRVSAMRTDSVLQVTKVAIWIIQANGAARRHAT